MPQTDLQSLQCKEKCHTTTCAAIFVAATLSCVDTRALTGPDCPSGCTGCCKERHTAIGYAGSEWGPPRSAVRSPQGACRKADGTKASVDEKWGLKDVAACRDACEKSEKCMAIEFSKPEPASGRAISKCAMLKEDPFKMVPLDGVVCLVKPLRGGVYSSVNLPGSREAGRFRRAVCGGGKHCQNLAACVCCRLLLPSAAPIDSGCTHFREFDLRGANLYNSKLDTSDFSGALLNSSIGYTLLVGNLNSRLDPYINAQATSEGALLDGANLRSATLHGANFEFTSLDKAMMDSASANFKTSFEHASLKGASLRGVGFKIVSLKHASFAHADLTQSDLSGVNANDANFVNATLSFASLTGVMAENANFSLARLDNAFFSGGNLKGAFFRGADLTGANFNDALIERADFTGAIGMETASWAGYQGIPYNAPPSILGCPAGGCASGR